MNIRKMTAADEPVIVPMVYKFYESDAVDHPVPRENLRRTFHAAVEDGSLLDGYVLEDEDGVAGFAYLSAYYACEVGGVNMMLEEIYLRPEARGKRVRNGIPEVDGTAVFGGPPVPAGGNGKQRVCGAAV